MILADVKAEQIARARQCGCAGADLQARAVIAGLQPGKLRAKRQRCAVACAGVRLAARNIQIKRGGLDSRAGAKLDAIPAVVQGAPAIPDIQGQCQRAAIRQQRFERGNYCLLYTSPSPRDS